MISDPDLAAKITALMLVTNNRLNESLLDVQAKCSDDEFRRYRRAVGKLMGEMLVEVLNPLWADYPELMRHDMRPGGMPRVELELHDSTLSKMETSEGWLNLHLRPACVHQWSHVDGRWRGQSWARDVLLEIVGGEIASGGTARLPSDVSEGFLSVGDARFGGMVPVPFGRSGAVELTLQLVDGVIVEVRGAGLSIVATNRGSIVEDLPDEFAPDGRSR